MSKHNQKIFFEPWIDTVGWSVKDFVNLKTPAYVVDEKKLESNLEILDRVQAESGCKILMALKGFSMFSVFPLVKKYLRGTEASSVNEARLGFEKFGRVVHTFSPAYTAENINEFIKYSDHLIFNSFSQWRKFKPVIEKSKKKISCGLRVNPEHSETETPMYDPCGKYSRLGIVKKNFSGESLADIDGLHFHNLCELNADALARTLKVFEKKFGEFLPQLKWVNFGGGHHITRRDYDLKLLIQIIKDFKRRYPHLEVYLEPGEAIALNAGVLVATVVDIFNNGKDVVILDVSAATHMPDVLEMPYHPTILGAGLPEKGKYNYRLGGPSCLAGDVIGDYSFAKPLAIGQKLVFLNMAIYTMVKNNTFNGIELPSIIKKDLSGKLRLIKKFGYKDFKERLS
ncbi:MAG: carboxynorspermidine decarboxylase [Patescibacteria group bacterium]|nr:carboxynorspermidine decarboxylase [Patescibacteria group bacterium]MDD4611033.1 carboxynorspermidine decarboxylase [Patescibacteria group bacterium]